MDKYFPSTKSSLRVSQPATKKRQYPYARPKDLPSSDLSDATATNLLLKTLSDASNPITHSDIALRAYNVISTSSGHQVSDGHGSGSRKDYYKDRDKRCAVQTLNTTDVKIRGSTILCDARIYIDGYLEGITDIELKRLIAEAGGVNLSTPSGATHIVTSMQLNGSKTNKFLAASSRKRLHVVRPAWIIESLSAGKKLSESHYVIVRDDRTKTLQDMWRK